MKKISRSTYKQAKYYHKVTATVEQLLKKSAVITPIEVFIQMGNLSREDYEAWRLDLR